MRSHIRICQTEEKKTHGLQFMRTSEYGGKLITFDYAIYIKDPTMRLIRNRKKKLFWLE